MHANFECSFISWDFFATRVVSYFEKNAPQFEYLTAELDKIKVTAV